MVISSDHLHSQTVPARKLKFWQKVYFPLPVMRHLSCVMWYVSRVPCHISCVIKKIMHNMVQLGGSVINGAYSVKFFNIFFFTIVYKINSIFYAGWKQNNLQKDFNRVQGCGIFWQFQHKTKPWHWIFLCLRLRLCQAT